MATVESIVGLDIGTSKVTAVIADHDEHEQLAILGVGTAVSSGLRRGVVINIEATLRSVVDAIEAAEQMAGHEVQAVVSAVAGSHIEGINSHGVVAVSGKGREGREVTALDIDRAVAGARAISIPMDREILHVLPREFTVDDQTGIRNPLDMIGVRLEVDVHIVTGSVTATQNLVKCINRAGFQVASVAFGSFAAAEAVLEQDEKDLGAIVIDIGGGTTNVLAYVDGAPHQSFVLPVGGGQISGDLSIMLKTSPETAEALKRDAGCAYAPLVEHGEPVIVPGVGGRPPIQVGRGDVCAIVQPRMAEILQMVRERLSKQGRVLGRIAGGLVLTGGGANLPGVVELSQDVFDLGARVGKPGRMGGLSDAYQGADYATAIGLVQLADRERQRELTTPRERGGGLRRWMRSFFE